MKKKLVIGTVIGIAAIGILCFSVLSISTANSAEEQASETSMHYELPRLIPSSWFSRH